MIPSEVAAVYSDVAVDCDVDDTGMKRESYKVPKSEEEEVKEEVHRSRLLFLSLLLV